MVVLTSRTTPSPSPSLLASSPARPVFAREQRHGRVLREELQARLRLPVRASDPGRRPSESPAVDRRLQPLPPAPRLENAVTLGVQTIGELRCPVSRGQLHTVRRIGCSRAWRRSKIRETLLFDVRSRISTP